MREEGAAKRGPTIDTAHAAPNAAGQPLQISGGRVGQGGGVEVRPESFDRIPFGGIGGEALHSEPGSAVFEGLLDVAAAMGGQPVPDRDDGTLPMPWQSVEEAHDLGAAHAAPTQGQQPAGTLTGGSRQHNCHPRQALPLEAGLQPAATAQCAGILESHPETRILDQLRAVSP